MKLASPSAELNVLRGLCHRDKKIAGAILSQIDEDYFYYPESKEIFTTIRKHMADSGSTPTYKLLINDLELSEEARTFLRDSSAVVTTIDEADKAAAILNRYRQARGLFNLAAHVNQAMQGSKVNLDELMQETATAINIVRSRKSTEDSFLHYGLNNNATAEVEDLLYGDHSASIIPTGLPEFDDVAGGFSRGAVVLLGAPSGCGKSLVAGVVAANMAERGYKVTLVPLEMSKREMTARILARVAKMDLTKILLQRMATGEKELVMKKYKKWAKKVKDKKGRLTIFKPKEDLTIEELMAALSAYDCDVKIIDYISLLKGTDGDDMWRKLSSIARYCKIHAEAEDCVVILLVQVDEDGKVRYSRGMAEHANNALIWSNKAEVKEKGIMKVEQIKSRNSEARPFFLRQIQNYMDLESVSLQEALGSIEGTDKPPKPLDNLAADA
jgi:replicative DNA helicase